MMTIGILTFHLGPNHGGYLQAHCLYEYLVSLGHDVEFINYKNADHHHNETFRPLIYRRPFKLYHAWVKERVFQKAYKELNMSEFTTDLNEVDWLKYDAVVVGSDVVWDYTWDWLGSDSIYFGEFGDGFKGIRVSYAASAGTVDPDGQIPKWVKVGLAKFDYISVRDVATAKIVNRSIDQDPLVVVDPTWLDLKYEQPNEEREKTLLVYAYTVTSAYRDQIVAYAKKHGLKIIAIGYPHSWADSNNMKMGPFDWVELMKKSTAVVAGTFHGALYAIKCQCQFVVLFNEKIKSRIARPLKVAGLESRMIKADEDFVRVMDEKIDYKDVFDRIEPELTKSREFLQKVLSHSEKIN